MTKQSSFNPLDAYFEKGGNFIDTANFYQSGSSESTIGEWAEKRGIRDQLFIATKYDGPTKLMGDKVAQKVFYVGIGSKALKLAIAGSPKNLRTDYIDLLYVHVWTWDTTVEELMKSLHNLVTQGKVLYLGISDTPAWVANGASFSALSREESFLPMARSEGMALAPWGVLAAGKLRTDAEEEARIKSGENGRTFLQSDWKRNEAERAASLALEKVAKEVGAKSITSVAIAYVLHKAPFVFPIVGGRKVEQLEQNIEALDLSLTEDQIKALESVSPNLGFPYYMSGSGDTLSPWLALTGVKDKVEYPAPIRPVKARL
ncbi:Aldo/keto reductase [Coprinopsis marcescibilis]|uniref:Aldo/keto reductase n=1 Tax=Coprinopsis marcescibilis TaxID=230819 RepID=A0A5C3L2B4_COPMA|nr:Aldo/keto reductase [Coprinopsis marcescibilis]